MRALIIASAALLSSPALAQTAPAPPAAAEEASEKKICKRVDTTGTRLDRKKVCATKKEWDQVARKGREFTERVQQGAGRAGMPQGT